MKPFVKLEKLRPGDRVAVLSPSFAAPGQWPQVHELGLRRLRDLFGLVPVEFPATRKLGATREERSSDLIEAFRAREIKAVVASLGGDDQVTYVKNLPREPFAGQPKPFFGFSDNTHFANHLWLCGVPSYYGASLFTQFAMQKRMDALTIHYLRKALFEDGEVELRPGALYTDIDLDWGDPSTIDTERTYEPNEGWHWDGRAEAEGITWGGCLESLDEMLRHGLEVPALDDFEHVVLCTETSEEVPSPEYVRRVYRAFGERGILERVRAVLVGRPKAWNFGLRRTADEKAAYRREQRAAILATVRAYNGSAPVVQNLDFGHTDPQICLPLGRKVVISSHRYKILAEF